MGLFLAVAKGSTANPPHFIHLTYTSKGIRFRNAALADILATCIGFFSISSRWAVLTQLVVLVCMQCRTR